MSELSRIAITSAVSQKYISSDAALRIVVEDRDGQHLTVPPGRGVLVDADGLAWLAARGIDVASIPGLRVLTVAS